MFFVQQHGRKVVRDDSCHTERRTNDGQTRDLMKRLQNTTNYSTHDPQSKRNARNVSPDMNAIYNYILEMIEIIELLSILIRLMCGSMLARYGVLIRLGLYYRSVIYTREVFLVFTNLSAPHQQRVVCVAPSWCTCFHQSI